MPKKHNIAYVKPEEPSFLRKLKEQIGYKEGPTVDTKRQDLGPVDEDDLRDTDEERPQVVVLRPGDLTAEEADRETLRLEKEEEEKPADLTAPIVFKKPVKAKSSGSTSGELPGDDVGDRDRSLSSKRSSDAKEKGKSKKLKTPSLLSFNEEDEEN